MHFKPHLMVSQLLRFPLLKLSIANVSHFGSAVRGTPSRRGGSRVRSFSGTKIRQGLHRRVGGRCRCSSCPSARRQASGVGRGRGRRRGGDWAKEQTECGATYARSRLLPAKKGAQLCEPQSISPHCLGHVYSIIVRAAPVRLVPVGSWLIFT